MIIYLNSHAAKYYTGWMTNSRMMANNEYIRYISICYIQKAKFGMLEKLYTKT